MFFFCWILYFYCFIIEIVGEILVIVLRVLKKNCVIFMESREFLLNEIEIVFELGIER